MCTNIHVRTLCAQTYRKLETSDFRVHHHFLAFPGSAAAPHPTINIAVRLQLGAYTSHVVMITYMVFAGQQLHCEVAVIPPMSP